MCCGIAYSETKWIECLLYGHWIDDATDLETALFELHNRCVVDACAFWENEDRRIVRIRYVLT